jgi:hypothetical protein
MYVMLKLLYFFVADNSLNQFSKKNWLQGVFDQLWKIRFSGKALWLHTLQYDLFDYDTTVVLCSTAR